MKPRSYVARTPEDLIALVPYVLGFHPAESVVLLTFGAPDGSFHARVDLPVGAVDRREVCEVLCNAVRRNRAPTTAVVVFSADPQRSAAICADLVPALRATGASVVDAIRADGARWWSVFDTDPVGHAYDSRTHPYTAEQVFEGHAALGSRADLVDSLIGTDLDETTRVSRAADRAVDKLLPAVRSRPRSAGRRQARWLHERLSRAAADGELLPTADAGRVLALIGIHDIRDVVWGGLTRDVAGAHVGIWRDLVRRAPPDLLPGAAAVLAFVAWLSGEGALSWCAVERCLGGDPHDALAHNVAALLQNAVPPSTWTPMTADEMPALTGWSERAS